MVKKSKKSAPQKPLRWRITCISKWRDNEGMTLEEAAEALAGPPYRIKTTHASLGRIENGKQMPKIELVEALAKLYRTDVHSLLNREPSIGQGETTETLSAQVILSLWDKADEHGRALIAGVAQQVVKPSSP